MSTRVPINQVDLLPVKKKKDFKEKKDYFPSVSLEVKF